MGNNSQLRVARPTISVAGEDKPQLSEGLLRLLIAEDTNGLYRCEAAFGNWGTRDNEIGFLYFGRDVLDWGKAVAIKLGVDTIFDGRIMGLEADFPEGRPPEITVLAEDRLQDLRMTRRTRSFADVSDADVLGQIASDHGLQADVDAPGPTYKLLAQINQSDLAFVRERARSVDADVWVSGTTLHVKPRGSRNTGTLQINYGRDLREFSVLADLAEQRTSLMVSGWDVAGKTALHYEASEGTISGELNGDQSGANLLQSALGQRKESLAHTVPLTSQEAQAVAESEFKRIARRFVRGRGVAEANAQLRVGSYVEINGVGPLFSGKYYVAEVRHLFDGTRGLRTEFTAERPGLGR